MLTFLPTGMCDIIYNIVHQSFFLTRGVHSTFNYRFIDAHNEYFKSFDFNLEDTINRRCGTIELNESEINQVR